MPYGEPGLEDMHRRDLLDEALRDLADALPDLDPRDLDGGGL